MNFPVNIINLIKLGKDINLHQLIFFNADLSTKLHLEIGLIQSLFFYNLGLLV